MQATAVPHMGKTSAFLFPTLKPMKPEVTLDYHRDLKMRTECLWMACKSSKPEIVAVSPKMPNINSNDADCGSGHQSFDKGMAELSGHSESEQKLNFPSHLGPT